MRRTEALEKLREYVNGLHTQEFMRHGLPKPHQLNTDQDPLPKFVDAFVKAGIIEEDVVELHENWHLRHGD